MVQRSFINLQKKQVMTASTEELEAEERGLGLVSIMEGPTDIQEQRLDFDDDVFLVDLAEGGGVVDNAAYRAFNDNTKVAK